MSNYSQCECQCESNPGTSWQCSSYCYNTLACSHHHFENDDDSEKRKSLNKLCYWHKENDKCSNTTRYANSRNSLLSTSPSVTSNETLNNEINRKKQISTTLLGIIDSSDITASTPVDCKSCCAHCLSQASTSFPQLPNICENSCTITSSHHKRRATMSRRLPASRLASSTTPSTRRHTMSNGGPRASAKVVNDSSNNRLGGAMSCDKNLATAADTYFYFYPSEKQNKSTVKYQKISAKISEASLNTTKSFNRKAFIKILRKLSCGTGYRTYYEKFLSIRLCQNCQIRWELNFTSNESMNCVQSQSEFNDVNEACLSWIPTQQLIDFSSSSSSSSSSSTSLATKSEGTVSHDDEEFSDLKTLYRNSHNNLDEFFLQEYDNQFQQKQLQLQQKFNQQHLSKTIFCPILTAMDSNKRTIQHHCCGCHNFSCTTFPNKLSFILSCDDAAAAYLSKIRKLAREQEANSQERQSSDKADLEQSDLKSSSVNDLLNEEERLRNFLILPFLCYPSLSSRLQVFNPHPERFYCNEESCLFCEFKRGRQQNDELVVNKAQEKFDNFFKKTIIPISNPTRTATPTTDLEIRKTSTKKIESNSSSADNNDLLAQKYKSSLDKDNFGTDADNICSDKSSTSKRKTTDVTETITTITDFIGDKDDNKKLNRRKKTAPIFFTPPTSILAIPLLAIEEKILKLLRRFCDDPEEPNVDERCNVCFTRRASVRAYPCGHQALCRLCSVTMIKKIFESKNDALRCVLCRRQIAVLRHQKKREKLAGRKPTSSCSAEDLHVATETEISHATRTHSATAAPHPIVLTANASTVESSIIEQNSGAARNYGRFSTKLWPWNWT